MTIEQFILVFSIVIGLFLIPLILKFILGVLVFCFDLLEEQKEQKEKREQE